MNRHWRPTKPVCSVKTEFRRVDTDTILFAMWLLGAGILISAFILLLEILLQSRYRAGVVVRIMRNAAAPAGKFATNHNDASLSVFFRTV
jgi:hypothetical protein